MTYYVEREVGEKFKERRDKTRKRGKWGGV
jgi:hypothetical protein